MSVYVAPKRGTQFTDPTETPYHPTTEAGALEARGHRNANCTMKAGAEALEAHSRGKKKLGGGDLRHDQGDQVGGTDLGDLKLAWSRNGYSLTIRSGSGRAGLRRAWAEGRAGIVQGQGETPTPSTVTVPHAMLVYPRQSGTKRYVSDPAYRDFVWVEEVSLFRWAESWNSSLSFAVTNDLRMPEPDVAKPLTSDVPFGFDVRAHVPAEARFVELMVAATAETSAGYFEEQLGPTAIASGTSFMNVQKGITLATSHVFRIRADGKVWVAYRGGAGQTSHLVVDLCAWRTEDEVFTLAAQKRIVDTRD